MTVASSGCLHGPKSPPRTRSGKFTDSFDSIPPSFCLLGDYAGFSSRGTSRKTKLASTPRRLPLGWSFCTRKVRLNYCSSILSALELEDGSTAVSPGTSTASLAQSFSSHACLFHSVRNLRSWISALSPRPPPRLRLVHPCPVSGYVYRDLKAANVLVAASGHIKLTDFGEQSYVPLRPSFCVPLTSLSSSQLFICTFFSDR